MARPREFDKNVALDYAMEVFWLRGYNGASMSELTAAMGINSPSLYAAFGNKRALFDQVLDRYQERRLPHRAWVVAAPTAREMAERMLMGAAEWLTDPAEPLGCLLVQCGLGEAAGEPGISASVNTRRTGIVTLLNDRFEKAKTEGEIPASTNALDLASYIYSVFCGMAVRAAAGTPRADLERTAALSMLAWPLKPAAGTRPARRH